MQRDFCEKESSAASCALFSPRLPYCISGWMGGDDEYACTGWKMTQERGAEWGSFRVKCIQPLKRLVCRFTAANRSFVRTEFSPR